MSMFETQEWESLESSSTPGEWESQEWGETGEYEDEGQFLGGILGSRLGGEMGTSQEMQEMQEMELAAELLEISSEAEFGNFLDKLFRRAAKTVRGFAKSPTGRALSGTLKGIAKTALPLAGRALGDYMAPGAGGLVGTQVGSVAANLFEVQLEGLGEQEAEYEVARRYIRFANAAARTAARAPSGAPPRAVARAALIAAARRHAPGLLRTRPGARPALARRRPASGPRLGRFDFPPVADEPLDFADDDDAGSDDDPVGGDDGQGEAGSAPASGRWIRRGHKIVILGI